MFMMARSAIAGDGKADQAAHSWLEQAPDVANKYIDTMTGIGLLGIGAEMAPPLSPSSAPAEAAKDATDSLVTPDDIPSAAQSTTNTLKLREEMNNSLKHLRKEFERLNSR